MEHPTEWQCTPHSDPLTQNEDIVPINGDSSVPVDEVMDAWAAPAPPTVDFPAPRIALARYEASTAVPARTALATPAVPIVVAISRGNGAFEIRRYARSALSPPDAQRWSKTQFVVSPVTPEAQRTIEKQIASVTKRGSGTHLARIAAAGYCVDARKDGAPTGRLFMIAENATSEQYASIRYVRRVGDVAAAGGFLRPQGDPDAYGRFVTQYAIWTKLEHWSQTQFTEEFITRSKTTALAQHKPWNADTEKTLRALAPHRWSEVQLMIQAADRLASQATSRGGAR